MGAFGTMAYETVVFDMDGTILDTIGDLTAAMVWALSQTGHACGWGCDDVRHFFGSGAQVAVTRALVAETGLDAADTESVGAGDPRADEAEVGRVLGVFKARYAKHCCELTRPFPGIVALLGALRESGIACAVVSNKMDPEVKRLAKTHFGGLLDAAVGECAGVRRKPAPDSTLRVLDELGADPASAVYVGDSEIDLLTARNAGLPCVAVDWGFRTHAFLVSAGAATIASDTNALAAAIVG